MKRILEPVAVATNERGWPIELCWRGRTYRTREVLRVWILQGRWWSDEERRVYFRLRTDRATLEVYHTPPDAWVLTRIAD